MILQLKHSSLKPVSSLCILVKDNKTKAWRSIPGPYINRLVQFSLKKYYTKCHEDFARRTRSSTKAFRIIFFVEIRVFSVEIHGRREARKEIFSLLIYSAADLNIEIITASTREKNYAIKKRPQKFAVFSINFVS